MAIHEKSLIRPENLSTHDDLVIDGIDVSGDWSTFIHTRVVADYNEDLEEEIAATAWRRANSPLLAMWIVYEFVYGSC